MIFRLFYRGRLRAKGDSKEKQHLRRDFHRQLLHLWKQRPLSQFAGVWLVDTPRPRTMNVLKRVGRFSFAPLVCENVRGIADLDIIFLRPEEPGSLVTKGDIDNRIKTLLDGLRMPKVNEIPPDDSPKDNEYPFFCLLEDDALVTHLSVTTDRLLDYTDDCEVVLVITVTVRVTETLLGNIGLA